eukprot:5606633-Amphidinium_carterae.1
MTKYLETAKIKKHSETIGLHPYIGNKSVNMITRGLRPRGTYAIRQLRATTPQPRQRIRRLQHLQEDEEGTEIKEEDMTDLDYFQNEINEYHAEEAARHSDIVENEENEDKPMKYNVFGFDKLLIYSRQLLLLSFARLMDDYRRRPVRGILHFIQRHEDDL